MAPKGASKTIRFENAEPVGSSTGSMAATAAHSKRVIIIDVTQSLFLARGYQAVTMSDVAAAAHVSLNTIYRIFPGKLQLFAAMVERHRHSMIALPGDYDELPLEAALARIFWADIDSSTERQRAELVHRIVSEGKKHPELLSMFNDQGPDYSRNLLVRWLEYQRTAGRLAIDDPPAIAAMLMDIVFGLSSPKFSGEETWDETGKRSAYLKTCFAAVVNGLRKRGPI